jgi:hypothetical protein
MSRSGIQEETLKRIGPLYLQRYATAHGWERKQLPERFQLALYTRPEDPTKELLLPQSATFGDYLDRIADFISGLASYHQVSIRQVLNEVLNPQSDVLRFGYDAPESKLGYVPFLTGMHLYDAALRSLSTATYDVIHPEKFHARMSNPSAEAYIESCRMGQTEHSSFVISCICPVEPASQLPVSDDETAIVPETPAFGRRVTQHLMKSVAQIRSFVLADQSDRLVNPEPGDTIISGNFLESLMAFPVENETASLYITASWDKSVPQPEAPNRTEVRFDMFTAIDDVARQLRPVKVVKEDKFIANVVSLRGQLNPEEKMEGDVILQVLDGDSTVRSKLWLAADDYAVACDAHKLNRYVSVIGVLTRLRKSNEFERYTQFQILDD